MKNLNDADDMGTGIAKSLFRGLVVITAILLAVSLTVGIIIYLSVQNHQAK